MALPKEPRQKMINLMYLVLTALLALNVSSEILNAFIVVDKSLQNSNKNLSTANATLYKSFEEKMNKDETREKATYWNHKAQDAKNLSDQMISYIDNIKQDLKKEAGLTMQKNEETGQMEEKFKLDDLEAATRLFGNGPGGANKGPELQKRLNDYRSQMLAIDDTFKTTYSSTFPVENIDKVKGQDGTMKDFTEGYFHMTPTVAALTLLSKFQNNIKNAENQSVSYYHSKIGSVEVHMDKAAVLVGQSSNYLMPGQEITITAGVGAYSSAVKSTLSVNGSPLSMVEGKGEYKTTVSGGGEHSMEVTGQFIGEDGKPVPVHETVKYTVGTPSGAAVMLDKMNVFYIGVDNPVTIGSPVGFDKTNVSISGGTISGSGSQRVVRVSAIGPASITVTADGHSSQFPFRVKRIPDPVFKIGSGKARIATVEFKNQQFCRADLENFDFDLHYTIVSATVYFSGANFNNVATGTISGNSLASIAPLIARCGPGSSVTFVGIKVQGPDGVRTIDERSFTLY